MSDSITDLRDCFRKGFTIDHSMAAALEDDLGNNPKDYSSRSTLIGYYKKQKRGKKQIARLLEWPIVNSPGHPIHRLPIRYTRKNNMTIHLANLWKQVIESRPVSGKILRNAAHFHRIFDKQQSIIYLKMACDLEPDNDEFKVTLVGLYSAEVDIGSIELAKSYLPLVIGLLNDLSDNSFKFLVTTKIARIAFISESYAEAKKYAGFSLELAKNFRTHWNYGNVVHESKIILGYIALKEKNENLSCERLLESLEIPGSPQIASFGPDFDLANDLLKLGNRIPVLEYLNKTKELWQSEIPQYWIYEIEEGKIPSINKIGQSEEGNQEGID